MVKAARTFLEHLDVHAFSSGPEAKFKKVLDHATQELQNYFPKEAPNWGAARKVMNIYLRDVLYNSFLSRHYGFQRTERWLEVPLDSLVAKGLIGDFKPQLLPKWRTIKNLTPADHSAFQAAARVIARRRGVARVHLDLYYWRVEQVRIKEELTN